MGTCSRRMVITWVIAQWIHLAIAQVVANSAKTTECNGTLCEKSPAYKIEKSAPPGFNDKTHYGDKNNSLHNPYDRKGSYWLVPPFLIGASTVIVVYIIGHCIYFHCYATKKMKRLAARQYPPAIVISDEPTSTGSYKTFTPILRYNEQGDIMEGQSFLYYQPFDDDEWERQMSLRRCSSIRSSRRSLSRSSSTRKKSISLQLPRFFGRKRASDCSTISGDLQPSPDDRGSPKPPRVCFVPVARSLSVPAAADKQQFMPSQGFLFSPVLLSRTQSCKSPSTRKPSVTPVAKINGSASDGDLKPQNPLAKPPMIIIGSGDSAIFKQAADGDSTSALLCDATPSTSELNTSTCRASSSTPKHDPTQKESQVLFHVGETGDEAEVRLCDIKEEHE